MENLFAKKPRISLRMAQILKYILYSRKLIGKIPGSPTRAQIGTSLLEVVLALALLGTSGIAFLKAINTGLMATNTVNQQVTVRSLGVSQLEVIRKSPYQPNYPVTVETPAGYSLSIQATPADINLQEIKVTVLRNNVALLTLKDFKITP